MTPISSEIRFPSSFRIGTAGDLSRMNPAEEYDGDPRGIVWIYEPPSQAQEYVMGIDPTEGITNWSRSSRTPKDKETNNGSIEIIRIGRSFLSNHELIKAPDVQVCEFAAPVDPFELGYIANLLGRLYAGTTQDQCLCIMETYPGPGGMTMRQMADLGYVNHWTHTYYADLDNQNSNKVGWQANQKSVRDLWLKASRHINRRLVKINSPFLAEEMGDARMDPAKGYAVIPSNQKGHGDRLRAYCLALWAANKWDGDIERTTEIVSSNKPVDWKDCSGVDG